MDDQEREERTERNREYLAQIAAEGFYEPKKNISDMSADYVDRIAREFHKQEAAGLPFELAPARGHGRTEHGREIERDYEPAAYELARQIGDIEGVELDTQGRIYIDADQLDMDVLQDIADLAPDGRITIHTADGDLFIHGGISPEGLQALVDSDYNGDYDDMIADQIERHKYKEK